MTTPFGKQPNRTAYVKLFPEANLSSLSSTFWDIVSYEGENVLSSTVTNANVLITGNLTVLGNWNNPSDQRLKENIEDLTLTSANDITKIIPKKYNYKSDEGKREHFGVIAQELEEFFPNLVDNLTYETDGKVEEHKVVNYIELIPLLLVKIKDLQKQIDELREKKET
jgi:hypothetical protein